MILLQKQLQFREYKRWVFLIVIIITQVGCSIRQNYSQWGASNRETIAEEAKTATTILKKKYTRSLLLIIIIQLSLFLMLKYWMYATSSWADPPPHLNCLWKYCGFFKNLLDKGRAIDRPIQLKYPERGITNFGVMPELGSSSSLPLLVGHWKPVLVPADSPPTILPSVFPKGNK